MKEQRKVTGLRSRRTLAWLRDHLLPATPLNYAVGYHYVNENDQEFKQELDAIIASEQIENYDFSELFIRHLLVEVVPKLDFDKSFQRILNHLKISLSSTQEELKTFASALSDKKVDLSKSALNTDTVTESLISETTAMSKKSEALLQDLARANKGLSKINLHYDTARYVLIQTNNSLSQTQQGLSNYSSVLADKQNLLDDHLLSPAVKAAIHSLINETDNMNQKAKMLEEELISASEEISELKQRYDDAQHKAQTDHLTDLLNREGLKRQYEELMSENSDSLPLVCMVLDIDNFKSFNDTHGHIVGDQIIKLVASALQKSVRSTEKIARIGGEEFLILLPRTKLNDGLKVAESLRKKIEKISVKQRKEDPKVDSVTVSLGVAQYRPVESFDSMFKRADKALYTSKALGRNRVTAESPD